MEFDQSMADKSTDISDAQRMSATTKRLELTPIHTDISPESLASGAQSDTFGSAVPTPTIASESEDTSAYQHTVTSVANIPTRPHSRVVLIVVIVLFAFVTSAVVYLLAQ